jgi:hypothetical protein
MAYRRLIIQLRAIVIQLISSWSSYNKHTLKEETPTTDGASIKHILCCTRESLETARELDFDSGPEFFSNFSHILRSTVKYDWDLVVALAPQPRTPELSSLQLWMIGKRTYHAFCMTDDG